VPHFIDLE